MGVMTGVMIKPENQMKEQAQNLIKNHIKESDQG